MNDEDIHNAPLKFNIMINSMTHPVKHYGVNAKLQSPPTVTIAACGNGACLFNSLTLLLTGHDTYNAIIWHVVCNYIDNPLKYPFLKAYIPKQFSMGKEYTVSMNMHNFSTWGTEIEIIAFAKLFWF